MDIQQTLLLPSQEALVQRLEHIASYSEQLVLVSGAKGSGKTTLVTALASELDNYNSALVICPMHAESAEIRRKILVQLISSPIFDDALPLADTLLRIQTSLTKPLHIIIDDAQHMPRELWAECLVLTQIRCAGKPISITFTIEPDSLAELNLELTEAMQALLLHVEIEPLSLAEREGLYRTLLIRSNKTPFIPREIIQAQIEKQSGTPTEVLALLKKALEDKPEEIRKWPKHLPWLAVLSVFVLTAALAAGMYLLQSDQQIENESGLLFTAYTMPESDAQWFVYHYGRSMVTLAPNLNVTVSESKQDVKLDNQIFADEALVHQNNIESSFSEMPESNNVRIKPKKDENDTTDINDVSENHQAEFEIIENPDVQITDVVEGGAIVERDKLEVSTINESGSHIAQLTDRVGYTLQIASVREPKSLKNILLKLESFQQNESELVQAKFKKRHIVLFGQFDSAIDAQQASDLLQQELALTAPWVRKWSDLKGYEIKSN
ncbi:ATP-binding protein [Shewanella sp. KT0246]|uniref:ATP-binding protein n=1 Tax=Shewanella sp. KT0246 TaxID=2815912 RepID=UPI001BC5D023|nr:AAA family ATPase [Shewanella sp. KT0246]GIU49296.1 ATPase AAA [Shewanella sp. KT0246]